MVIQSLPPQARAAGPETISTNVPENPTYVKQRHTQIELTLVAIHPPTYSIPEPANRFYSGPENLSQAGEITYLPVQQILFPSNSPAPPEAETTSRCFTTCDCTESLLLCISDIFIALCR